MKGLKRAFPWLIIIYRKYGARVVNADGKIMKTTIDILVEGLARHKLEALVIGGYSLPAYGVMRQTLDVDCLIAETEINRLKEILSEAGYVEKEKTENFVRYSHPSVCLMDVDVVFVDQNTFNKMMKESMVYRMGKVEIRVPSLIHLISLKLHAVKNNPERENRDMGDIGELLKSNPGNLSMAELKSICGKYGPEGTFAKLERYV